MKKSTAAVIAVMGIVPFVFLLGFLSALWNALAVWLVWRWYLPNIGEPSLVAAFGLALIAALLCQQFVYEDSDAASKGRLMYIVLSPLVVVAVAAVGKLFF